MKSSAMIEQVKANSRAYENKLRGIEKDLSEAHENELRIQHNLTQSMKQFATAQVDGNTDATQQLQRMLDSRTDAEQQLRMSLAAAEAIISQQNDFSRTLTANIEAVYDTVEDQLAANEDFQSLYAQAHLAVSTSTAAAGNFKEIDEECTTKLAAFGADRFYSYLRAAQYGTPAYRGGRIARSLDSWVAGLCNFNQNFSTEQTLRSMQETNRVSFQALEAESTRLKTELEAFRSLARRKAGAEDLQSKLDSAIAELANAKDRASNIQLELYAFAEKTDPYYVSAHSSLTQHLSSVSLETLKELADETPDQKDDAELDRIADYRQQLKKARERIRVLGISRDSASSDYERAKGLERDLRTTRYTSSDYRYSSGLDLDGLLVGYMAGSLSNNQVIREVESNRQSVPSQPTYSSGSSFDFGGGGSGGFGGFSTSGSDSSGGFSTSDSL